MSFQHISLGSSGSLGPFSSLTVRDWCNKACSNQHVYNMQCLLRASTPRDPCCPCLGHPVFQRGASSLPLKAEEVKLVQRRLLSSIKKADRGPAKVRARRSNAYRKCLGVRISPMCAPTCFKLIVLSIFSSIQMLSK